MHGVQPAAKIIPTSIEFSRPIFPFLIEKRRSFIIKAGRKTPSKNSPMTTKNIPPSMRIKLWYCKNSRPTELAEKPNM